MNLLSAILIGVGGLTWDGRERRTDRYGTIAVSDTNAEEEQITTGSHLKWGVIDRYRGCCGKLVAKIIATGQSVHIGDLFRGFYPTTPNVGDIILLGHGKLFPHKYTWGEAVGVLPTDGRNTDWLDPQALYRCHEQTVELYFIPD